jgi:hypothetical protein
MLITSAGVAATGTIIQYLSRSRSPRLWYQPDCSAAAQPAVFGADPARIDSCLFQSISALCSADTWAARHYRGDAWAVL